MPRRPDTKKTGASGSTGSRRTSREAAARSGTAPSRPLAASAAPGGGDDAAPSPDSADRARRGDLLDAVAARCPTKRPDAKLVMDLVLEEMGRLLEERDELVVPPLGKLTVKKRQDRPGGAMLTVKLKRPGGEA